MNRDNKPKPVGLSLDADDDAYRIFYLTSCIWLDDHRRVCLRDLLDTDSKE